MGSKQKRQNVASSNSAVMPFYKAVHIPIPAEMQEHIFQFCNVVDLSECRLVSKFWNTSAKNAWRDTVFVNIFGIEKYNTKNRMVKFLEFIDLAEKEGAFVHYDKFKLQFSLQENELATFNSFWSRFGAQIKILKLFGIISFPHTDTIKSVLFQYCPNLEQLHVDECCVQKINIYLQQNVEWSEPQFGENRNLKVLTIFPRKLYFSGVSWMDLLSHFPRLMIFRLTAEFQEVTASEVDEIYRTVTIIREHDPTKLLLNTIYALHGHDDDNKQDIPYIFQVLADPNLHLREIAVNINGIEGTSRLNQILINHEASLQKLELKRDFGTPLNPESCFLQKLFGNITELKLHSRVFTSMTFLKFTPNLKKLALNDCSDHWYPNNIVDSTAAHDMSNVKLEKCVDLEADIFLSCDEVNSLITWLPNVTRLKMALDNTTFSLVCQILPELVSLHVLRSKVDDIGLTGLDEVHVRMVNEAKWDNEMGLITTVRRANVTSLKNLQSFYFSGVRAEQTSQHLELGFCSTLYGFLQIPSLKNLTLQHYKFTVDSSLLYLDFRRRYIAEKRETQFVKSRSTITDICDDLKSWRVIKV